MIEIKNVSKDFGKNRVLNDISFTVNDGEFMVLVGPSGCGKSSLLRTIAGLESLSAGEIHASGIRIDTIEAQKRNISMVFQNYALYPHMSVRENLSFALKLKKMSDFDIKKRTEMVAELLKISSYLERKPKELSGGQRQRVALGRALIRQSPILLFDEPLSNLDAHLRTQMRIEIKALHKELKNTVIYVTHDQVEATTLGERIAILKKGHLEQLDTPEQIYAAPANRFVAEFIGSPEMNFLSNEPNATWGIRPEDFNFATGDIAFADAKLLFTENLGSQKLHHFHWQGNKLRVLTPSSQILPGEVLTLKVPMTKVHKFDTTSGLRIT